MSASENSKRGGKDEKPLASRERDKNSEPQVPAKSKKRAGKKNLALDDDGAIDFPVLGVGASAGGLEAYRQLLSAMPPDTGASIVLIQHLDPGHESMMAELLSKHTTMPVSQITDDTRLMPNHVYMIPPNAFVELSGDRLRLVEPVKSRGMRLPIDYFFRSLAKNCRERSIAVILSGTGSDGAVGMKEVKAAGGMTMVEDPLTASYDGMPRAAVRAGWVDFVLPVRDIPEALSRYIRHPYIVKGGEPNLVENCPADHFRSILDLLQTRTDYDFHSYKKGTLTRRIERRLGIHHLQSLDDYVAMLRNDPGEVRELFRDLLISVTSFFRDDEVWEDLEREVIAQIVREKEFDEPVRIWIPGCATGEEAYSVAILLFEQFAVAQKTFNAQIFATDIDEDAIEKARSGRFPKTIASEMSAERLAQFFDEKDEEFVVKKKLRESVVFAIQNLIGDPPFSKLDLICCRNLLIYIESDVQSRIFQMFHSSLVEDGYLFIGNSETTGQYSNLFKTLNKSSRLFQKIGKSVRAGTSFPISGEGALETRVRDERPMRRKDSPSVSDVARRVLLDRFAPASVVINRSYDSLFFHGAVRPFLDFPSGEPTRNLYDLVLTGLKNKLRGLVHQAITSGELCSATVPRIERDDDRVSIKITVEPIDAPPPLEDLLVVSFEDDTSTPPLPDPEDRIQGKSSDEIGDYVGQLEYELEAVREDLQGTIEELETSNEELKASNEEVLSMNEELQSTNEELETSREELQSLNEELSTVNSQLEEKVLELEDSNNDLTNLLSSTDIATIFLDTEFCIRRYTGAVIDLISLIPSDVGRPFSDIATQFSDEHLLKDARTVLEKLTPMERELRHENGAFYIRKILPYRTDDNRIEGVVITFTDVSELRRKTEQVALRRKQQAAVAELGTMALGEESIETLLDKTCQTVSRVLEAPLVKFLELDPSGKKLHLVSGVGWKKGLVGKAAVDSGRQSQGGFTLVSSNPVVVSDLSKEKRFSGPQLLLDHEVVGGLSVSLGPIDSPWGVLGAHDRRVRNFSKDDVNFLQSVANLIYAAIERQQTLSALRESEKRYRLVADAVPVLLAYCDTDCVYQFCNETYREWFGVNPDSIVGKKVKDLLGEDAFARIAPYVERALNGEKVSFETELTFSDKATRRVQIEYIPHLGNGEILGYFAMVQDVTERARSADLSRQLAAIVETSQHAILSKDLDGNVLSWNRGAEKLYGYTAEEMIGRNLSVLFPPDRRNELKEILDQIKNGERIDYLETVRVRKDGSLVDISVGVSPVLDDGNRVIGASAIARDISKRLESAERLSLALEAGKMGVWDWNPETGICQFDERVRRLLGFDEAKTSCRIDEILEILHPDDRESYSLTLESAKAGKNISEGKFRVRDGDDYRWLAARFHVRRDSEGKALQLIGIDWDITEMKEAESALRDAKGQLEQRVAERTRELQVLSDNVPALFAFLDRELRFQFINKLFEKKFVMDEDEFVGRPACDAFSEQNFEEISRYLEFALEGKSETFEIQLDIPRDGSRVIRAYLVPRHEDDDSISGVFFLADDITDERRLQQEVLKSGEREKERVGRDLHDSICQELSAISLFTKAFIGSVKDSLDAEHEQESEALLQRINTTTQNARKLAKGLSPVSLEKKTLSKALEELAESVTELFEDIDCEFVDVSGDIQLDEQIAAQLYLIGRESVFNAARHAKPEHIRITLGLERNHLLLSIADDGGGVVEELKENKGIGLRSMHYRARTLGGELSLQKSSLGNGIEVLCRLRGVVDSP